MKRLLSLFAMTLVSVSMTAFVFDVDGVFYEISSSSDKTVKVTYCSFINIPKHSGNVVIPEKVEYDGTVYSVTAIAANAFCDLFELKSITIPYSVSSIGIDAFFGCSNLQSVEIQNSIMSIGRLAFGGCKNLKTINLGDNITSIERNAFSDCSSLTTIVIPNSVTSIGDVVP